jgi:hypothetical protein
MIRSNYIFETPEGISRYLKDLEVFLNSSPSVDDIEGLFNYLGEMRSHYATLAHVLGVTKSLHAKAVMEAVDQTDDETYKRVKNSSTLVVEYAEAKQPNIAFIHHKADFMKRCLTDASSQLTTMIAFRKEEMRVNSLKVNQK